MNSVIDNMNARRSVRHFEQKPITKDVLETIVHAGNAAPSGMNTQNWRFVVVTDKTNLKKLAALALPKYKDMLTNAPEPFKSARAAVDNLVQDPVYYDAPAVVFVIGTGMVKDMDCPMVCQNMMLAARSLGVGSCWVYLGSLTSGESFVKTLLELKDGESVYGPIVFGYPKDGTFPPAPAKKPAVVKWA